MQEKMPSTTEARSGAPQAQDGSMGPAAEAAAEGPCNSAPDASNADAEGPLVIKSEMDTDTPNGQEDAKVDAAMEADMDLDSSSSGHPHAGMPWPCPFLMPMSKPNRYLVSAFCEFENPAFGRSPAQSSRSCPPSPRL